MDSEDTLSRRTVLRRVGVGGGVALAGGITGTLLSNRVGTLSEVMDREAFPGNLIESGKFELQTAWKFVEEPTKADFNPPSNYDRTPSISLPLGRMDPGSTGTVYGAFTLDTGTDSGEPPNTRAKVALTGSVSPSESPLVEKTELKCWEIDEWVAPRAAYPEGGETLSVVDQDTLLRTACKHTGGFGMEFTLPSEPHKIAPGDQLSLEITMTATQCSQ